MSKNRSHQSRRTQGNGGAVSETCGGKVIYHSRKNAKNRAALSRKKSGHDNIEEYKCSTGAHYHLGHHRRKGNNGSTT